MTTPPTSLPFGSWPSPVSARLLAGQQRRLSELQLDGDTVYWLEARPWEGGRNVLMSMACRDGHPREVLAGSNVRSRAHEYGGGSYTVHTGLICVVDATDQRVYRLNGTTAVPLTPPGAFRHADLHLDLPRQRLLCVQEDYSRADAEPVARIVAIALDGSLQVQTLASGADFYSNPRLAPDGRQLSWLSWNHPHMPWDSSQCHLARLDSAGLPAQVQIIAGGDPAQPESVFQPQWSPDGELYLVSDRSNWWNIYRWRDQQLQAVTALDAEFATPQWVFGMSTYGFVDSATLMACFTRHGQWQLARIDLASGALAVLDCSVNNNSINNSPFTDISQVQANARHTVFLGASASTTQALICYAADTPVTLVESGPALLAPDCIAAPQAISFRSGNALAHAFYYPPRNPDYTGPAGARPPLLVIGHGGPTGACETGLNLKIQYWTSRGFAVVDVNYRGSTGYGRAYRNQLRGQWGIADVEDVCAAADYLVTQGLADPQQLAIRGSSAGGYTVLAALTFRDTFRAGASIYGIGDLETLARDTHKFEARYLDSLVGPYPQARAVYRQRSPLYHADQLTCPVIFLQGLEDKVVPPAQAQTLVDCLRQRGIPVTYLTFAGEGHGFRAGATIQRALEAEYHFYSQIFGFTCPPDIDPVQPGQSAV